MFFSSRRRTCDAPRHTVQLLFFPPLSAFKTICWLTGARCASTTKKWHKIKWMKKVNNNWPNGRRSTHWTSPSTSTLSIKLICMVFRLKYIMATRCSTTFALIFKINKRGEDTDQITCNVSNNLPSIITRKWRTTNGDKLIIIGRRRKLPIQKMTN